MKAFLIGLLFIAAIMGGLNAAASGLHALDPQAPAAVLAVERTDGWWQLRFMDRQYQIK